MFWHASFHPYHTHRVDAATFPLIEWWPNITMVLLGESHDHRKSYALAKKTHENPMRIPSEFHQVPQKPAKIRQHIPRNHPNQQETIRNHQQKPWYSKNPCNKTSFFVARPSLPACATWPSSSRRRRKRNCCRRWMHDPGWTTWFEVGIGPLWPYLGSHSEDLAMKNGEKRAISPTNMRISPTWWYKQGKWWFFTNNNVGNYTGV